MQHSFKGRNKFAPRPGTGWRQEGAGQGRGDLREEGRGAEAGAFEDVETAGQRRLVGIGGRGFEEGGGYAKIGEVGEERGASALGRPAGEEAVGAGVGEGLLDRQEGAGLGGEEAAVGMGIGQIEARKRRIQAVMRRARGIAEGETRAQASPNTRWKIESTRLR